MDRQIDGEREGERERDRKIEKRKQVGDRQVDVQDR